MLPEAVTFVENLAVVPVVSKNVSPPTSMFNAVPVKAILVSPPVAASSIVPTATLVAVIDCTFVILPPFTFNPPPINVPLELIFPDAVTLPFSVIGWGRLTLLIVTPLVKSPCSLIPNALAASRASLELM